MGKEPSPNGHIIFLHTLFLFYSIMPKKRIVSIETKEKILQLLTLKKVNVFMDKTFSHL